MCSKTTTIFSTSLNNFPSSFHVESEPLITNDKFLWNLPFGVSTNPKILTTKFLRNCVTGEHKKVLAKDNRSELDLVGIIGTFACHIFDKKSRKWAADAQTLGFKRLAPIEDY